MKRREFIQLAATTSLLAAMPRAFATGAPAEPGWRTFELTYTVDLSAHSAGGRVWLPLPGSAGDYQRVISTHWQTGTTEAALYWDAVYQAPIFTAQSEGAWQNITVTVQVATRDRSRAPSSRALRDTAEVAFYLQPTAHMPVDGIVAETSRKIVRGKTSPDDKARAIYDWVVDNTFREPTTRGCGLGNIRTMLETGNLGGKCADINSLFVGLARAAGIPAREMYGVRVAESGMFQCLGKAGDISKAQHCRAEYFSPRYGWVPVDPADVRKAVLEAKLPLTDPKIAALRERLFGFWEMNWVGFNTARDFELIPAASQPLPYLMYPYAELGGERLDGRDPEDFRFELFSAEI